MKGFLGTLVVLFVMLVLVGPATAETVAGEAGGSINQGLIALGAGLGLGIAAFGAATGQGRATAGAMESIGRNPNSPSADVPIPRRSVVKFKPGKEMRAEVMKLAPKQPDQPTQPQT